MRMKFFAHSSTASQNICGVMLTAFLAILAVSASFLWQGHAGISSGDEGFLWYGAQRVLAGEVPIRDFYSYDPGRYYWIALLLKIVGNDSIIGLRIANAITQSIALFIGLLLIKRSKNNIGYFFLALSSFILLIWMFPWFKQVDILNAFILIGSLSALVKRPTHIRYFLTGLCIGFVSVISRYQGFYGFAGYLGVMAYLRLMPGCTYRTFFKEFIIWFAGVLVGYSPVIFMLTFVHGFAQAFWADLHYWVILYRLSSTSMPIPWPWSVPFGHLSLGATLRALLTGFFFLAYPVFGFVCITLAVLQKLKHRPLAPALVACAFLAIPFAHYAYSLPETSHLALGSIPFLIGSLIIVSHMRALLKWLLIISIALSSIVVVLPSHPGYHHMTGQLVESNIAGTKLYVFPDSARFFSMLNELIQSYAPKERSFLVVPAFTTAYSAWKRKSPIYEDYAQFPRDESFQKAEIERIKKNNPGFVIVDNTPFGSIDLCYSKTHPLIYQYIRDHFELLPKNSEFPLYQLYKSNWPNSPQKDI